MTNDDVSIPSLYRFLVFLFLFSFGDVMMSQKWVDDVIMTIDDVIGCRFGKMRSVWKSNRRIWNTMWEEEEEYYFLKSKFKKIQNFTKNSNFFFSFKKKNSSGDFFFRIFFFSWKEYFFRKKNYFFWLTFLTGRFAGCDWGHFVCSLRGRVGNRSAERRQQVRNAMTSSSSSS